MRTFIDFTSAEFPPYPGEEEEINPGLWGKRLAEFIVSKLPDHGFTTDEFYAEDWGWEIPVRNQAFPIYIGCTNARERSGNKFVCSIEPNNTTIRRGLLFQKISTETDVSRVADALETILRGHPGIKDLSWRNENYS